MNTSRTNISYVILSVSSVILLIVFTTSAGAFITGSAIRCLNEGEDVRVSFLYNDPSTSLMRCKCLNQEVVCKDPSLAKCPHNGKVYKSGETWKNGTCNKCSCSGGDVSCQAETCDPSLRCSDKARRVHLPGDCCPSCVENDGQCTLTGHQPFSLTSFDGKSCSFAGVCNYVMVRDCSGKSFAIHLVHEIVANETGTESGGDRIMAVVVKVDQTKVRLSRPHGNWHIRAGRKPAVFPFIRLGVLTVLVSKSVVHVRTHLGVKVAWDGRQDLSIAVPSKMKSKVCGLCGNFNSDTQDDQLTRKGRVVNDTDRFISSWKVGKSGVCAAAASSSVVFPSAVVPIGPLVTSKRDDCSQNWKKRLAAMTACNRLKASCFTSCHRSVPISSFYRQCMADVCSCSKSDCHCESIASYINQCRETGLPMIDAITKWNNLTSCNAPLSIRNNVPRDSVKQRAKSAKLSNSTESGGLVRTSCPSGSIFRQCASSCRRTCKRRTSVSPCRKGCRPGCECPAHLLWHQSRCIKPSSCPSAASFRLQELLQ